jgi:hypothetical protein
VLKRAFRADVLHVGAVVEHALLSLETRVLLPVDVGETPLLGDDDLLTTGELVTSTAESFGDNGRVVVLGADGEDDLTNVDTGDSAVRLTPSTTHTGLKTEHIMIRQLLKA